MSCRHGGAAALLRRPFALRCQGLPLDSCQAQLEKTLKDLGTDYLDLYCIHWPVPGKHVAAYQQVAACAPSPPPLLSQQEYTASP